jgi:hypothetical protein
MDDPNYDEKRLKRLRHAAINKNEKVKTWRKRQGFQSNDVDPTRFKITLDADVELDSREYMVFEKKLAANNIEILEKFSNRFARGLLVKGNKTFIIALKATDDHIVDIISPAPVAHLLNTPITPWIQAIDSAGERCTKEQSQRQIAIVDSIRGTTPAKRTNFGQGAIVIVWDQPFSNPQHSEYQDRRGGKPVITDLGASFGEHGSMVTSTCCGDSFGLASGAELAVVGMTSAAVESAFAYVDKVIQAEKQKAVSKQKAIVVNMSFKFNFDDRYPGGMAAVKKMTQIWVDIMELLKSEYPRLAFVNASGNDGDDACERTYDASFYSWPSNGNGGNYGLGEEPFVRIGAAQALNASVPAKRRITTYSNRGRCVHAYSYGDVCAFDATKGGFYTTRGTSFAAPIFSSLVALSMTQDRSLSGDDAIRKVVSMSSDQMESGAFVTVPSDLLYIPTTASPKDSDTSPVSGGSTALAAVQLSDGEKSLSSPPATSNTKIMYGLAFVVVCAVLVYMFKKNKRTL